MLLISLTEYLSVTGEFTYLPLRLMWFWFRLVAIAVVNQMWCSWLKIWSYRFIHSTLPALSYSSCTAVQEFHVIHRKYLLYHCLLL